MANPNKTKKHVKNPSKNISSNKKVDKNGKATLSKPKNQTALSKNLVKKNNLKKKTLKLKKKICKKIMQTVQPNKVLKKKLSCDLTEKEINVVEYIKPGNSNQCSDKIVQANVFENSMEADTCIVYISDGIHEHYETIEIPESLRGQHFAIENALPTLLLNQFTNLDVSSTSLVKILECNTPAIIIYCNNFYRKKETETDTSTLTDFIISQISNGKSDFVEEDRLYDAIYDLMETFCQRISKIVSSSNVKCCGQLESKCCRDIKSIEKTETPIEPSVVSNKRFQNAETQYEDSKHSSTMENSVQTTPNFSNPPRCSSEKPLLKTTRTNWKQKTIDYQKNKNSRNSSNTKNQFFHYYGSSDSNNSMKTGKYSNKTIKETGTTMNTCLFCSKNTTGRNSICSEHNENKEKLESNELVITSESILSNGKLFKPIVSEHLVNSLALLKRTSCSTVASILEEILDVNISKYEEEKYLKPSLESGIMAELSEQNSNLNRFPMKIMNLDSVSNTEISESSKNLAYENASKHSQQDEALQTESLYFYQTEEISQNDNSLFNLVSRDVIADVCTKVIKHFLSDNDVEQASFSELEDTIIKHIILNTNLFPQNKNRLNNANYISHCINNMDQGFTEGLLISCSNLSKAKTQDICIQFTTIYHRKDASTMTDPLPQFEKSAVQLLGEGFLKSQETSTSNDENEYNLVRTVTIYSDVIEYDFPPTFSPYSDDEEPKDTISAEGITEPERMASSELKKQKGKTYKITAEKPGKHTGISFDSQDENFSPNIYDQRVTQGGTKPLLQTVYETNDNGRTSYLPTSTTMHEPNKGSSFESELKLEIEKKAEMRRKKSMAYEENFEASSDLRKITTEKLSRGISGTRIKTNLSNIFPSLDEIDNNRTSIDSKNVNYDREKEAIHSFEVENDDTFVRHLKAPSISYKSLPSRQLSRGMNSDIKSALSTMAQLKESHEN